MNVIVNGEARSIREGTTLRSLILELRLDGKPVAVELNRNVVPKARHAETVLHEADTLEIVHFVGGG